MRNDDSSVLAEFERRSRRSRSARAGPGPGPRAAAGLPSRCWPAACRRGGRPHSSRRWSGLRGSPSGCRWRRPRGRSSNRRTRVASVVPSGLQATPSRRGGQRDRPDEPARLRFKNPAGGGFRSLSDDRDLGPVGTEGQVRPAPARASAGWADRSPGRRRGARHPRGPRRSAGCPG